MHFIFFVFLAIQHKCSNWKVFLVKRLTGVKTLPPDFAKRVRMRWIGFLSRVYSQLMSFSSDRLWIHHVPAKDEALTEDEFIHIYITFYVLHKCVFCTGKDATVLRTRMYS